MSSAIRVIIVDDEPLARDYLRSLLAGDPDVHLVAECRSGEEAVEAIDRHAPELIFLDIQMPGMTGFDVIESIRVEPVPAIMFVTAYDQYAIKAFETHAIDYLLKPFDESRFRKALDHAKQEIVLRRDGKLAGNLAALLKDYAAGMTNPASRITDEQDRWLTRIPIKTVGRSYILRTEEVDWIEAADYYINIHARGKAHMLRETMKWIEERLDPGRFFRVHRGAIVNIDKIKELQAGWNGDFTIILIDGSKLPLSRRRRRDLEKLLGRAI